MSRVPESFTYWRSRVATLSRTAVDASDAELIEARRNMRAARLAEQVAATLDSFPPLTDTQRDRIAALLRPGTSQ